jgi:hypothetical protein
MGLRDWLEERFQQLRAMRGAPSFCGGASSVELGSMEQEIEEAVAAGQVPLTADSTFVRDGRSYDLGLLKEERLRAAEAIGEAVEAAGLGDDQATGSMDMDTLDQVAADVEAEHTAEPEADAAAAPGTTASSRDDDWRLDDIREPELADHQAGAMEDERRQRSSMSNAPTA